MIIHFGVGAGSQFALGQPIIDFGFPLAGQGGVTPPEPEPTVDIARPGGFLPYRKGERRARSLEWDKPKDIAELLEEVYQRLHGDLRETAEPTKIRSAVAEHAQPSDAPMPPVAAVDFAGLAADMAHAKQLLAAYEQARLAADEDEDAILSLLMS